MIFTTADDAFGYYLNKIITEGVDYGDTKALFNVGFTILNPGDNIITDASREWKEEYAKAEWEWYESGEPFTSKLGEIYGKVPPIWKKMESAVWFDGCEKVNKDEHPMSPVKFRTSFVNSNYGWQWGRKNQLHKVIQILKNDKFTRRGVVSIYDGKEIDYTYEADTPCTLGIVFYQHDNILNMSVYMRSNDLWYGFCNDQYCFSMLQQKVAEELSMDVGTYYHHATNLHLYNNKL